MLIRPPAVRQMRRNLWAKPGVLRTNPVVVEPTEAGPAESPTRLAALKELGDLLESGVLTEEEFQAEKARILG